MLFLLLKCFLVGVVTAPFIILLALPFVAVGMAIKKLFGCDDN